MISTILDVKPPVSFLMNTWSNADRCVAICQVFPHEVVIGVELILFGEVFITRGPRTLAVYCVRLTLFLQKMGTELGCTRL